MDNAQYIRYMEELTSTVGWQTLLEECQKQIYQLQADSLEAKSWEAVLVNKGKAHQLAEFIALESIVAAMKTDLEGDNDADISL